MLINRVKPFLFNQKSFLYSVFIFNEVLHWRIISVIFIDETYNDLPVTKIGNNAFKGSKIESLIIPSNIDIGAYIMSINEA